MDIRCLLNTCCNYNCTFCHNEFQSNACGLIEDNKMSFNKEEFHNLALKISRKYGLGVLKISGGEPLLTPDEIYHLLNWAKALPFSKKILFSNLSLVTEAILETFSINGLDEIRVNIPSLDEDKYEIATRTRGHQLGKVLQICKLAKNKGLSIRANMVVSEYSVERIFQMLDNIQKSHPKYEASIDEYAVLFDAYLGSDLLKLENVMRAISTNFDVTKQSDRKYVAKMKNSVVYFRQCLDWEAPSTDIERGEVRISPPGRKKISFKKGKAYVIRNGN